MVKSELPPKRYLKKAGSRESEIWHTIRVDECYLACVPGPDSAPATIKNNALPSMYSQMLSNLLHSHYTLALNQNRTSLSYRYKKMQDF